MPALAALTLLLGAALPCAAADLYVDTADDDGPGSLRQAIADANPGGGDTIRFVDGFAGTIALTGGQLVVDKDITIVGPGADWLQISGNGATRVFSVAAGKTVSLSGLKVVQGTATGSGGGIYNAGNLSVQGCQFFSNTMTGGSGQGGGAVYSAPGSQLSLTGCDFADNTAAAANPQQDRYVLGGAIYARGALSVQACVFAGNTARNYRGGAIAIDGQLSDPTVSVSGSRFEINTAAQDGGAIYDGGRSLEVSRCRFSSNFASGDAYSSGGAIYNVYGALTAANSVFDQNSAVGGSGAGGAIYSYGDASAVNCTFAYNKANGQGGGIAGFYYSIPVDNCVFWGNYAPFGPQVTVQDFGIPGYGGGTITVTNSDVQGGLAGLNGIADGGSNIDADPLFVIDPQVANPYDLHLLPGSPCINAGRNASLPATATTDLDGNPRVALGTVDMGAYETQIVDNVAPTLTWGAPSPKANASGWNNTAVSIDFTTADDSSGVASVSMSGPITFFAEGANQTVDVTLTDVAGNSATFTSPAINIDLTAPTSTGSSSGTTVTLASSDSLSGVQATYYRINGGAQRTYTGAFTVPAGLNSVAYWSVDAAGNTESVRNLSVDTRAAVTVAVDSVSGRKGRSVSLTATVSQTSNNAKLSGKAVMFTLNGVFVGNGVTNKKGVATVSYTIPASAAPGAYTIQAVAQPDGTYKSGTGTGTLTVTR